MARELLSAAGMRIRLLLLLCAACGGTTSASNPTDAGSSTSTMIGSACVPSEEADAGFTSTEKEISVEEKHPQCPGAVCLVNHFRGRTDIASSQCADRPAGSTVTCSCRCANADGKTDDGASYCTCPGSLTCTQLIASLGASNDTLSGAYCIPAGSAYAKGTSCR